MRELLSANCSGEAEDQGEKVSIYQTMSEFLQGDARILETRTELIRLGWSAERANGWLLKNMRFAVSAKIARHESTTDVTAANVTTCVPEKSARRANSKAKTITTLSSTSHIQGSNGRHGFRDRDLTNGVSQ